MQVTNINYKTKIRVHNDKISQVKKKESGCQMIMDLIAKLDCSYR